MKTKFLALAVLTVASCFLPFHAVQALEHAELGPQVFEDQECIDRVRVSGYSRGQESFNVSFQKFEVMAGGETRLTRDQRQCRITLPLLRLEPGYRLKVRKMVARGWMGLPVHSKGSIRLVPGIGERLGQPAEIIRGSKNSDMRGAAPITALNLIETECGETGDLSFVLSTEVQDASDVLPHAHLAAMKVDSLNLQFAVEKCEPSLEP